MTTPAASIRTVALVGHGDAGKTTFLEQALHRAGAIPRAGSVAERSTVGDHDPDERERGHSLDVAAAHLKWHDRLVQILDCPGYPDFAGVATAGLWAADTAVFFVNAVSGVGVNTRRLWDLAGSLGKARVIVISRMDAENADPEKALAQVRSYFGETCRPFNLPVGAGAGFQAVLPCFDAERPAPGKTLCGDPGAARSAFFEAVIEADDALLERYLGGEELPHAEVDPVLTRALVAGKVVPVLFCSSVKGHGVGQVLDLLAEYAPSAETPPGTTSRPPDAPPDTTGKPVAADGPFLASVFKVTTDLHVGKICFLRVWRGSLPADGVVWNSASGQTTKLAHSHPARPQGKDLVPVPSFGAGDVVCVTKVDDLRLGCTLADPAARAVVAAPAWPAPMVAVAVESKNKGDEHKVSAAFHRIVEEDPSVHVARNSETHELIVSGLSSLHVDVLLRRMKNKYKVDLVTHLPRVPLKETVLGRAEGLFRHKKQTGGRGQFAEVQLRVHPAERGAGFRFSNATVGGSIPHNFLPAVEKGVREQMERGCIAGYPVVDVVVEAIDGKSHPVDSSEAAFKIASARAFRDAFDRAPHCLLEPIMELEIDVPSRCMGDVTGDLNGRRGRIVGMDAHDDRQVVRATAPLSEIQTYSTDLRSMTSGEGSYTVRFSHLDPVPGQVAKRHVDAWMKTRGAETED